MPLPRFDAFQVVIGADAKPLGRDGRALRPSSKEAASPSLKRKTPTGTSAAPEAEERGGAAAATAYQKAAKKADWTGVLARVHGIGQCAACERASDRTANSRCPEHRAVPGDTPHERGPCSLELDRGLAPSHDSRHTT